MSDSKEKKNPLKVTDYGPISLCNVLYKLCSKVLANRLKPVLPHVISQYQSAFISGRLIFYYILVSYETFHSMATKIKGREGYMALMLYMSKAYYRIDWPFIKFVARKIGFNSKCITYVMKCLQSVSYSVLVNRTPNHRFFPS